MQTCHTVYRSAKAPKYWKTDVGSWDFELTLLKRAISYALEYKMYLATNYSS
jgi:hypothetical protein